MQRIPTVTLADVERIVRRDFAGGDVAAALDLLARYRGVSAAGTARVRVAALKLAHGELAALAARVDDALRDARDVLAAAEYPGALAAGAGLAAMPEPAREALDDADGAQYQAWLTRPDRAG